MPTITAARVLRPDGTLRPGSVTFAEGVITAVGDPAAGVAVPDVTVSPGLIDVQVNGYGAWDVWDGEIDDLGAALAVRGTTSWCPTLTSRALDAYGRWFGAHHPGPGEVGVHLEGPFIAHPGAHRPEVLRPPDLAWLADLPSRVRIVTMAPELPGAIEAIAGLSARGVVPALGHSDATYEQARGAARAGARMVTHVFNAMSPLGHRRPGLAGAALTDPALAPGVIGDGVHVHPALLGLILATGRAVLVSDAVAWERHGLERSPGDAARLPGGALAGSVVTLAEAVRVAVTEGAVPLAVALWASTAAPASLLGLTDRGVLAPGTRADIVVLDETLAVSRVWVAGEPR